MEIEKKSIAYREINKEMILLKELIKDMDTMVKKQGEGLDKLEDSIDTTEYTIAKSEDELVKAKSHQDSRLRLYAGMFIAFFAGTVFVKSIV